MKFVYFNDTGREVSIHSATKEHGTVCDMTAIQPLEERVFVLPKGTCPWIKMWDYGEEHGLSILVSPRDLIDETMLTNTQLLDQLEDALIEKGHEHPDDRRDLFLHEVFEILEGG